MIAARNNAPGTLAVTAPARASPCLQPFRVSSGHKTSGARANTSRRCGRVLPQAAASPIIPTTVAPAGPSQAKTPLDIVFISSEVAPWSKTGGLGDVVGSLPVELAKRGHNVFSIAPRFDQYADAWDTSVMIEVDGEEVRFFHTVKQGVHRVWIDHPWFLAKVWGPTGSKLYGAMSGADFTDNQKRFSLFAKAALEALTELPFLPGEDSVLVTNDWHTALVPVLIKDFYQPQGRFLNTPCAMTVHNVAFQGRFWPEQWADLGLPEASRERFAFEDGYPKIFDERSPADENGLASAAAAPGQRFAKLNWLRAGITACDRLLTVSPNYAVEMASGPALGVELNNVIAEKGVEGIVNGMDVAEWNPALDPQLAFKYNEQTMEAGKSYAKAALQRDVGLPVAPDTPVFGFIGRLEEQKGVDILIEALDRLPKNVDMQVVVLGTGKAALEAQVRNLANRYPGLAVGVVKFSNPLAHLITAGADFMLVPSRFEPCGLIQLHAMAYGTVPLVASTGGLVDTVKEGVTGFQMGAMDIDGLIPEDADAVAATMLRAAEVYKTPAFGAMRDACIRQDLSWAGPARKWEAVLTEMKLGVAAAPEVATTKETVPTPVQKLDDPAAFPEPEGPKPSEVAAASAAPKLGAAAPPTSPAAVIAAAAIKAKAAAVVPPVAPTASRAAAAVAAKASVLQAPAPTQAKAGAAAAAKPAAAKPANGAAASSSSYKKSAAAPAAPAPAAVNGAAKVPAAAASATPTTAAATATTKTAAPAKKAKSTASAAVKNTTKTAAPVKASANGKA